MPDLISIPEDFHEAGQILAQLLIRSINGEPAAQLQNLQGPF
jgi:DNA-binding LacI/PurR family transcriptional regulator